MASAKDTAADVGIDTSELDDWRAFLRAHALLSRRLDDELRAEQGLSLAEYDALIQLVAAPGRRLRMNQLADQVLLSRSGITRLVDRLEADGLVIRSQCSTDARGAEAVVTREGVRRIREARRTHLRGVRRYFIQPLDPTDRAKLGRSLDAIAGHLCAEPGRFARTLPAADSRGARAASAPDGTSDASG